MSAEPDDTFLAEAVAEMRLDGFANWAREEGGPVDRDDLGRAAWYDPEEADTTPERLDCDDEGEQVGYMKPVRTNLEDSTVKQDVVVLRMFAKYLAGMNRAAAETGGSIYSAADPAHLASAFPGWHRGLRDRGLRPSTIERYLVTMRRYARFRGIQGEMRHVSAPFNRRRRGEQTILTKGELKQWLSTISEAPRIELATWLLLAGVQVSQVASIRYGVQLIQSEDHFKLTIGNHDRVPVPAALNDLLETTAAAGDPVLRSTVNPSEPIPMPTLRQMWNRFRRGSGPTMRDVQVLARRVHVDRNAKGLVWASYPR